MSSSAAVPSAEQPLIVRDDHFCFGCGRLNAHGLQLQFAVTPERDGVWAPFRPSRAHEGFAEIVHGGIVTAVLDEVMGWALFARGIWAVTATIEVKFRKPVAVDVTTRAIGRIRPRSRPDPASERRAAARERRSLAGAGDGVICPGARVPGPSLARSLSVAVN